ncbi:MAG: MBOAT family protein [Halioglobus sp.]|nr:MBOAT family protein [Halioglobus sp.]
MLFTSPVFLFAFLPLVLALHYFAPARLKNSVLLLASLLFYSWGETLYVLLMLVSIAANYCFGVAIEHFRQSRYPRLWLAIGVATNLSLLAAFKYANFLVDTANALLQWADIPPIVLAPVHLPLGISFFTFQAMSYIIDVYRGDVAAQRRPGHVALYIALFPQLVAGPIVRYHDISKQIVQRHIGSSLFVSGARRFLMGLAKKLLIANSMGQVATAAFSAPTAELGFALAWLGIICYALQIYFDFSGYSDMAIGLGRMLGFRFQENFNYPYIATSLQDFWRRWHISLSSWFRDYLYIPLGGNRSGAARTYFNLMLVFFLCGLWHGASWNFVLWGMIHGCFLVLERGPFGAFLNALWRPLRHAYTLIVVCFAWVFFRAETLPQAFDYAAVMLGMGEATPVAGFLAGVILKPDILAALLAGAVLAAPVYPWLAFHCCIPVLQRHRGWYFVSQWAFMYGLAALVFLAVASTTFNPFIYFRF